MNHILPVRLNGYYNGFSMYERSKVIPIRREMVRRGLAKNPDTCSVCGFRNAAGSNGKTSICAHHEDYREPLLIHPVCRSCHYRLHTRFRYPDRWLRRVEEHYCAGEWFTLLTMNINDMLRPFDETYPNGLPAPSVCKPNRLVRPIVLIRETELRSPQASTPLGHCRTFNSRTLLRKLYT